MAWKKVGKALLFPPMVLLFLLIPMAAGVLTYAFVFLEETDPLRIAAYVLSAYALTVWCCRAPTLFRRGKAFRDENPYAQRWREDTRLRVTVTLCGNVLWNGAYAALQLGLGLYHRSFWFCSLAGYYFLLALMRLTLVRHTLQHRPGEKMQRELRLYRNCGWIFLLMNLALTVIIFYMVHENRTVRHHEITTIAMAAYTFTSLTTSIVNVVRYRRYCSPVFSASKAISLAAACVSLLTLEGTMLATFGSEAMSLSVQRLFLMLSGGAVSIGVVAMALFMIIKASRTMKGLENDGERSGNL